MESAAPRLASEAVVEAVTDGGPDDTETEAA